jgi:hypothetical protein
VFRRNTATAKRKEAARNQKQEARQRAKKAILKAKRAKRALCLLALGLHQVCIRTYIHIQRDGIMQYSLPVVSIKRTYIHK